MTDEQVQEKKYIMKEKSFNASQCSCGEFFCSHRKAWFDQNDNARIQLLNAPCYDSDEMIRTLFSEFRVPQDTPDTKEDEPDFNTNLRVFKNLYWNRMEKVG